MRRTVPSFLAALLCFALSATTYGQTNDEARIKAALKQANARSGLAPADIDAASLRSHNDAKAGIEYAYLQQQVAGIKVWNHVMTVALRKGKVVSTVGRFATVAAGRRMATAPTLTRQAAIEKAAGYISSFTDNQNSPLIDYGADEPPPSTPEFSEDRIAKRPIEAELVWVEETGGSLRLCWNVNIDVRKSSDWWNIRVDAHTGAFVEKDNLTVYEHRHDDYKKGLDNFSGVLARPTISAPAPFAPPAVTSAGYNVISYPVESALHGSQSVDNSPWLRAGGANNAVTNGWHFDGLINHDSTRGNNVHAYLDIQNTNLPSLINRSARSTTPIPSLSLISPLSPSVHPSSPANRDFALTNLFYWNNITHNVLYQYGFTEAAGNFQTDNLGRGGLGNDQVRAEAQDAFDFNNANFGTPVDGFRPRMQMFLWLGPRLFTVNSPAAIAGSYQIAESQLSANNRLVNLGPITGRVVLYNNSGGTPSACTPATNAAQLAGNIALIDRATTCTFLQQILNAQATGARAVIMRRLDANPPAIITGVADNVTIPVVQVSLATGNLIAAQLANNVEVTLAAQNDIDGDLDNGIIVHEYGHGVSNRLTGGPANVSCLTNREQGGEGWSDYLSLMLTTDWASAQLNDGSRRRPIGNYAVRQPLSGNGIRRFAYSTDMSVNPLTYANLPTSSIPHGVGEVLCATLWDMTWNIIQQRGSIEPNLYNAASNGGNAIALNLVMQGMKLQPCSPGYIDVRNSILAADDLLYGGVHRCAIWNAFARRGMGYSAAQGSSNQVNDQTVAFDLPPFTTACPPAQFFCYKPDGQYTIPAFTTTANNPGNDNCASIAYSISGATTRSGNGGNASGAFNPGENIITWTVNGVQSCQTTVTVNPEMTASIPDAYALSSGVLPNTVYVGYQPASAITLSVTPGGGTPGYTYLWSNGSTNATITVSPTVNTTYTVTVTDSKGCTQVASKTVRVMDVRSGKKGDKVAVCHRTGNGSSHSLSIASPAVADHLAHGDMLGDCNSQSGLRTANGSLTGSFAVNALPNPSSSYFTINISSDNAAGKVAIRVTDAQGRLIERRDNLQPNGSINLGANYRTGVYFIDVEQGANRQQLKLFKVN